MFRLTSQFNIMLGWFPNIAYSTNQRQYTACACLMKTAGDGELIQMEHFYHGNTIRHPNSSCVTTTLYGKSVIMIATIMRSFRMSYFDVSCRRRMSGTLAWHQPGFGDACQSGKMVTLLKSSLLLFKMSLLPNHRVKYLSYYCKVVPWYIEWTYNIIV